MTEGLRLGPKYINRDGREVQDIIPVEQPIPEPRIEVKLDEKPFDEAKYQSYLIARANIVLEAITEKFPNGVTDNKDDIALWHPVKMVTLEGMIERVLEDNQQLIALVQSKSKENDALRLEIESLNKVNPS